LNAVNSEDMAWRAVARYLAHVERNGLVRTVTDSDLDALGYLPFINIETDSNDARILVKRS